MTAPTITHTYTCLVGHTYTLIHSSTEPCQGTHDSAPIMCDQHLDAYWKDEPVRDAAWTVWKAAQQRKADNA